MYPNVSILKFIIQEDIFANNSFVDIFYDIPEIHVTTCNINDPIEIDSRVEKCIIIESQFLNENFQFPSYKIFDGKEYELRVVASINQDELNQSQYTGLFFSRHGGCYSKWWIQKRSLRQGKSIPLQIEGNPFITSVESKSLAVYIQRTKESLKKHGNDILRFIGGQTHAICARHNHPLITVPDWLINVQNAQTGLKTFVVQRLNVI